MKMYHVRLFWDFKFNDMNFDIMSSYAKHYIDNSYSYDEHDIIEKLNIIAKQLDGKITLLTDSCSVNNPSIYSFINFKHHDYLPYDYFTLIETDKSIGTIASVLSENSIILSFHADIEPKFEDKYNKFYRDDENGFYY